MKGCLLLRKDSASDEEVTYEDMLLNIGDYVTLLHRVLGELEGVIYGFREDCFCLEVVSGAHFTLCFSDIFLIEKRL